MDQIKKHQKLIGTLAGLCVFLAGLAVVMFYIYKRCRSEYNADFTDTLLWAHASVESGHFYNPDYWYAYFLPFSGIPIMIPIVAVFGLSYFSHQLGMTVFVILFALALIAFMRCMDMSFGWSAAMSGIVLILMCASKITRMIFYGHIIHYSLAVLFMCVAFALLKRSDAFAEGRRAFIMTVLISLWCMLCATNGMATIVLFFIPFAGCLVIERYLDPRPISLTDDLPLIRTVACFAAGGFAGFVIKALFFSSSEYENSITALLPSDGWVWKQSPFLLEWIKVLTDESTNDVLIGSFDGIRMLVMYLLALVILAVPVFALINYKKTENRLLRLFIIYYWLMFAMTMLTYSVSYAVVQTWRLAGLVCTALMLTMVYTFHMLKTKTLVRWFILIAPVIALCTLIAMLAVKNIPSAVDYNQNDKLISIFRQHGLTRGYSFFWDSANAATVLSDGEIVVSPIVINPDGTYEVNRYQSEPWEYEDVPGLDRYFVVVDDEYMDYASDTLGRYRVDEIKYNDDLYIWIFDRNIFEGLEPVFCD